MRENKMWIILLVCFDGLRDVNLGATPISMIR